MKSQITNYKFQTNLKFKIQNSKHLEFWSLGFWYCLLFGAWDLGFNKKSKSNNINTGFTLVETLVYITIISVVVVSFVGFSISISNSRNKAYVIQEVQANARTALDLISQRIRAAAGVNIEACVFDSDPGVLSLNMLEVGENPTIIGLDSDDGSLQITQGAGDPVIITSNKVKVTNLVFTNLTPLTAERENIRIEITVEYGNTGGDIEYTYAYNLQTAVSLRQ